MSKVVFKTSWAVFKSNPRMVIGLSKIGPVIVRKPDGRKAVLSAPSLGCEQCGCECGNCEHKETAT